jgi:aminoglycoside phosphotransferase (APT) family kinase protein
MCPWGWMTELRGLDEAKVAAWLVEHVRGCVPPVAFSLIAGGHSNLTFGATDATGHTYVVRRGPLGRSGGGAHDMAREHRVISALAGTDVPVPTAFALCEDANVTGASFYVMSRVDGAVADNPAAADTFLLGDDARRRAGQQVVDVLADLHLVDVDAVGLGNAARRDDFLERQIHRFRGMWEQNQTRALPLISELADRLTARQPPQRYTGVVHGDYRIGNVMLEASGTLVAVLDWELWTLGDVLADVGFLLNSWREPADPEPQVFIEISPTIDPRFGSRADALARYAARTGFDLSDIDYYRGFQHWRMAVLAEGVKRRYETAQMATAAVDFDHLDRRVLDLAGLAHEYLRASAVSR